MAIEGKQIIEIMLSNYNDGAVDKYERHLPIITPLASALQLDNEVVTSVYGIGILTIDSIDLRLPIIEGGKSSELKVNINSVPSSTKIDEDGNCIISGHRKFNYDEMLNRLNEVDIGDIIEYTSTDGTIYEYKVYETKVTKIDDNKSFGSHEDKKKLTFLITIPIHKAPYKIFIQAELINIIFLPLSATTGSDKPKT